MGWGSSGNLIYMTITNTRYMPVIKTHHYTHFYISAGIVKIYDREWPIRKNVKCSNIAQSTKVLAI